MALRCQNLDFQHFASDESHAAAEHILQRKAGGSLEAAFPDGQHPHPSLSSASKAARSRSRFPAIFALKSVRVAGSRNIGQPWPCQRHPWTRITARCFGKTRSGWPGSDDTWRRKRMPAQWRPRCSRISGLASRPRIRLILNERRSGL